MNEKENIKKIKYKKKNLYHYYEEEEFDGKCVKSVSLTQNQIEITTKRSVLLLVILLLFFIIPGIIYLFCSKSKKYDIQNNEIVKCKFCLCDNSYFLYTNKGNFKFEIKKQTSDILEWLKLLTNENLNNKNVTLNVKNITVKKEDRLKIMERLLDLKKLKDSKTITKSQFNEGVKEALKNSINEE